MLLKYDDKLSHDFICELDTSGQRIADLHREIELRDRKIEEQEAQLAIKDSIVKKQGIMLAELQETQFKWHRSDEKPVNNGWYLCAAAYTTDDGMRAPCIYTTLYFSNSRWPVPFTDNFCFMAWAEIPAFEGRSK